MTKVFISYSRKDKPFALELVSSLNQKDLETWFDSNDIPPSSDWRQEIKAGIEGADAFLFLLSPGSIQSAICHEESELAIQNGKRLIPIVVQDVDHKDVHPAMAKINWIYCRKQDDFDEAIEKILSAINTDLEWVKFHRQIQVKALEWVNHGYKNDFLLQGEEIQGAEIQLVANASKEPHPTDLMQEFVSKSRQVSDRRRRLLLWASIGVAILMTGLAFFGFVQARLANDRARIALSRQLAAQAQVDSESQLELAMLLGAQAYKENDNYQTRSILMGNLQKSANLNQFLTVNFPIMTGESMSNDFIYARTLIFSHNGKYLLSASCNSFKGPICEEDEVFLWNMNTRLPAAPAIYVPDFIEGIGYSYFSPDDAFLYIDTHNGRYKIEIAKISSGKGFASTISTSELSAFRVVSPDGKILADWDNGHAVTLRDSSSLDVIAKLQSDREIESMPQLAFSKDGKMILAAVAAGCKLTNGKDDCSQTQMISWDIASRHMIYDPETIPGSFLFLSPHAKIMVVATQEKGIGFWDVLAKRLISSYDPAPLNTQVRNIVFSPDEGTAVILLEDSEILLWDINSGRQIGDTLPGAEADLILPITFSPEGKILATSDPAQDIINLWNVSDDKPILQTMTSKPGTSYAAAFSQDGVLQAVEGNAVLQWDVTTGAQIGSTKKIAEDIQNERHVLDFQSGLLASVSASGDTALFDLHTGEKINTLPTGFQDWGLLAISPAGNLVASAISGRCATCIHFNLVKLWDVRDDHFDTLLTERDGDVTSFAFSPDGKILAIGRCPKRDVNYCTNLKIQLWDTETRKPVREISMGYSYSNISGIAINHKNTLLAAQDESGQILFWDLATLRQVGEPIKAIGYSPMTFSPDDKILAVEDESRITTPSVIFTLVLWDVTSHQMIGQPVKIGRLNEMDNLYFSPDGKRLVFSGCVPGDNINCDQGVIRLVDLDPASWLDKTCRKIGRNFTRKEWAFYLPEEPYPEKQENATCPQWPVELKVAPTPIPALPYPGK